MWTYIWGVYKPRDHQYWYLQWNVSMPSISSGFISIIWWQAFLLLVYEWRAEGPREWLGVERQQRGQDAGTQGRLSACLPWPSWWRWGRWLCTGVCLLVSWRNFPIVQRVCVCRTSFPKTGAETKTNTFVKGQFPRWPYVTFLFLCYNYTSPWLFSEKLKLKPRTPLRGSNGSRGKETQIHKRNLDILWDPKI